MLLFVYYSIFYSFCQSVFHGTKIENVKNILKEELKSGNRNVYGKGIYCAPKVEYDGYMYQVVIQVRARREKIIECKYKGGNENYWYIEDSKDIRNFGVLIKRKEKQIVPEINEDIQSPFSFIVKQFNNPRKNALLKKVRSIMRDPSADPDLKQMAYYLSITSRNW